MKDKKRLITVITILIVITVIIILLVVSNKKSLFNKFINNVSEIAVDKLDYKNISGNTKLNIKMDCITTGNIVISDMDYTGDYQINLEEGYINIDGEATYNKEKLDNNIYINNNNIYILSNDIYNKYVSFDAEYLKILNYTEESKNIINILSKELNKVLKSKYYSFNTVKFNGQKVNKTTLNLTGNNYSEIRKKLIKNLTNNEDFIKNLAKYKTLTKKETKKFIKNYDFKGNKFSLYTSKIKNDFVGFEFNSDEVKFIVKYKNNKYHFEYYLRGGLKYSGSIKVENNKIKKINFQQILSQLNIEIQIKENNIKYNQELKKLDNIDKENIIRYNNLTEEDKDIMKKNNIISNIYDNYTKRFIPQLVSGGILDTGDQSELSKNDTYGE